MLAIWLTGGLLTWVMALTGYAARRNGRWLSAWLLGWSVLIAVLGVLLATGGRREGIALADHLIGAVIGVVGWGVVPVLVFYSLGYALPPKATAVACVVLLIPVIVYAVLVLLWVASYAICLPDQYECPV